jgi:hypothetical protein
MDVVHQVVAHNEPKFGVGLFLLEILQQEESRNRSAIVDLDRVDLHWIV